MYGHYRNSIHVAEVHAKMPHSCWLGHKHKETVPVTAGLSISLIADISTINVQVSNAVSITQPQRSKSLYLFRSVQRKGENISENLAYNLLTSALWYSNRWPPSGFEQDLIPTHVSLLLPGTIVTTSLQSLRRLRW